MNHRYLICLIGILASGCQNARPANVSINTADGQPLPKIVVSAGGSQRTIVKSITVASGVSTRIGSNVVVNPDCSSGGLFTVRSAADPAHGKMILKKEDIFPAFAMANPRFQCNKKRMPGMVVQYRSERGFSGTDTLSYEEFSPSSGMQRYEITINVL